jgi:uncharacterized Zn finger protein
MAKKKKQTDKFINLTWDDLEEWAGYKIVSRGKRYQKQGRVSMLARTEDGNLDAIVKGSDIYGTKVLIMPDGRLESICTCPYTYNCKHGVATVLEYIDQVKRNIPVPSAVKKDERSMLIDRKQDSDEPDNDIDVFLRDQSRENLIELVNEVCVKYPEVERYLQDRIIFSTGSRESRIKHLRSQIREKSKEPGWQNYWDGEGFTPDFSEIRKNMETLLDERFADDVLSLGRELMSSGIELVETSHDEGETAIEIEECIPVIIRALEESSLDPVEKLDFAVNAIIDDEYGLLDTFNEFIESGHPADVWDKIADNMLARLENFPDNSYELGLSNYKRDHISNWAVFALEKSGRDKEIIPLCEKEAPITASYTRLVNLLIDSRQYDEAEKWIHKGISSIKDKWPGIASDLRRQLLDIRTKQKNPQSVAALRVYEYVDHPSPKAYQVCKKASEKVRNWKEVRTCILNYHETGKIPWDRKEWPLPQPDFGFTETKIKKEYPMIRELISIFILEKDPEKVLFWYDRGIAERRWRFGFNTDEIAEAVKGFAPERAVDMWKATAEGLINRVNPKAYQEAVKYLRRAQKIMIEVNKQDTWDKYIQELRNKHARKTRLMEELNRMDRNPILIKTSAN